MEANTSRNVSLTVAKYTEITMKKIKSTDKNYIELDLQQLAETEKAIRVSDGTMAEWIPKSQLEDDPEHLDNGLVRIVIPEWLAQDKGFI